MIVTLLCNTVSAVELKLDAEALHVLSAAVKFTSRLNPQCRELAEAFDPVFRDTTAPQSRGTERQQLSSG